MKALKYKTDVYDGALAWSHGFSHEIEEIFIPHYGIGFNLVNDRLNVFKLKEPRQSKKTKEIEIEPEFAAMLEKYLNLEKNIKEKAKIYFPSH
ncbi:MAG: hypothetical protein QMD71_03350 [bacterium]|nr:hypothetical protein [bacterium]